MSSRREPVLKGMTGLIVLALAQTSITDAGLKHRHKLTKPKELNLSVTFVSRQAAKQLQAALPDCKIRW